MDNLDSSVCFLTDINNFGWKHQMTYILLNLELIIQIQILFLKRKIGGNFFTKMITSWWVSRKNDSFANFWKNTQNTNALLRKLINLNLDMFWLNIFKSCYQSRSKLIFYYGRGKNLRPLWEFFFITDKNWKELLTSEMVTS